MLLASFRFDWPPEVLNFFSFFQSVTDAPQQLFSLDCLFQEISKQPRFYNILICYWILPILGAILLGLFWVCRLNYDDPISRQNCKYRFTSSWLVFIFLIHPGVANVIFGAFNCFALEKNTLSLREELSDICWEGRHLNYALTLGLSGMIFWVVGLPLWTGLVLREKRKQLGN